MPPTKTAYLTGAASGIGRALAARLARSGTWGHLALADTNLDGAAAAAAELTTTTTTTTTTVRAYLVDVRDWASQRETFMRVVRDFGRVDAVFAVAGVGERVSFLEHDDDEEPDLGAIDVNLRGAVYTASLAVQQMRRQARSESGFRGNVVVTASICGFYSPKSVPLYTASKHGVVGFVRSFGKKLEGEGITLNAVCPNVVRTSIGDPAFYDMLEAQGLLTGMEDVLDASESFVDNAVSGECAEVGPNGGFTMRAPVEYLDLESKRVTDFLAEARRYIYPRSKG